jgi:hypothetical protein
MRRPLATAFAFSIVLCAAACGKPAPQPPGGSGRVTVGVTTTGAGKEALKFTVAIEPAGIVGSIKADAGVFSAAVVPVGAHVVRLTDLPARCRVDGGPERAITVSARRSATLRFAVNCN